MDNIENVKNLEGKYYKHYKGGIYHLIRLDVKHTETNESMVYYRDTSDKRSFYVRPLEMFFGNVSDISEKDLPNDIASEIVQKILDGEKIQRFTLLTGLLTGRDEEISKKCDDIIHKKHCAI